MTCGPLIRQDLRNWVGSVYPVRTTYHKHHHPTPQTEKKRKVSLDVQTFSSYLTPKHKLRSSLDSGDIALLENISAIRQQYWLVTTLGPNLVYVQKRGHSCGTTSSFFLMLGLGVRVRNSLNHSLYTGYIYL